MSPSKKITCKKTFRKVFICLRPRTPYPPPLHTVYVYTVYLFTHWKGAGGGGEELNQREGRKATVHKAGSKIPTLLTVSSVYKL
jgi:hypothetical protein